MGRLAGFASGVGLTTAALWYALATHQQHRGAQSASLRQQALVLHSLVDPDLVPVDDPPRFRVRRVSWSETWKDRWNAEVEGMVRAAQRIRLDDLRAAFEGRVREWREGK